MSTLDTELIRLEKAGLIVRKIEGGNILKFRILKPTSTRGNARKQSEFYVRNGSERILCSPPRSMLVQQENSWVFKVWEWTPGPGPGDFRTSYASISDAVDAILDYYFGDPSKMNPPELLAYYEKLKIDI